MLQIAIQLRAMQLFTHSAHHLCARTVFHQDHEFFSEVYQAVEDDYDTVIERIIGLTGEASVDLNVIMTNVSEKLKSCPSVGVKENKVFYQKLLEQEKQLCQMVEVTCKTPGTSQGVIQSLGTIAEKSEVRQYKINRRVM